MNELFSKIKETIEDRLSNERLGEISVDVETVDVEKRQKRTEDRLSQKTKGRKEEAMGKEKEKTRSGGSFFKKMASLSPVKNLLGKKDAAQRSEKELQILELLGVPSELDTSHLMTNKDIARAEFSLIAPTGLDPNEVASFLDKVERNMFEYKKLFQKREEDLNKLLAEIIRIEQDMSNAVYMQELDRLNEETDADLMAELDEKLVVLRLENEELKAKNKMLEERLAHKKETETKPRKKGLPSYKKEKVGQFANPVDSFEELDESIMPLRLPEIEEKAPKRRLPTLKSTEKPTETITIDNLPTLE